MGLSHLLIGIAATATAITNGYELLTAAVVLAAAFGSLAPDIDTPHSSAGRFLPFVSWPLYLAVGHRTFTHSVIGLAGTGLIAGLLEFAGPLFSGQSFLIGYVLHVAGNFPTREGVAVLYPFNKRRIRIWPRVRTGGRAELAVVLPIVVAFAAAAVQRASRAHV